MRLHATESKATKHLQLRIPADYFPRVQGAAEKMGWTLQYLGMDSIRRNVDRIERAKDGHVYNPPSERR